MGTRGRFLSDSNGWNLSPMKVHGDGLRTSNPVGGADIEVYTGRDGSYISGSFTLAFRKFSCSLTSGFLAML